ncbi:MAG: hypothetical protein ACFE0O_00630 [Opitutales bacterium]
MNSLRTNVALCLLALSLSPASGLRAEDATPAEPEQPEAANGPG